MPAKISTIAMSRSSSQAGGNRGTAIVEPGGRYVQLTGNQLNRGGGKWQKIDAR